MIYGQWQAVVAGLQTGAGSGYSWGGDSLVSNRKVVLSTSCSWGFFLGSGGIFLPLLRLPYPSQSGSTGVQCPISLLQRSFLGRGGSLDFLAAYCIFGSALAAVTLRY